MLLNQTERILPEARAAVFNFAVERDIQAIVNILRQARPEYVASLRQVTEERIDLICESVESVGGP